MECTDIFLALAMNYLGRLSHALERRPRCQPSGGLGGWASDGDCGFSSFPSEGLSYHGFIGVSSTLEFKSSIGICWVALGVFADRPFFGLSLHLFIFLFIIARCYAWQRGDVLVDELATAAPENKGKTESFHNIFLLTMSSSKQKGNIRTEAD